MKALGYIDGNVIDIDLPYDPKLKNGARFLETMRQLLDCEYMDFEPMSSYDVLLVMQDLKTRCSSERKRISALDRTIRGNVLFISTGYPGEYIDIKEDLVRRLKEDLKIKEE